MLKMVPGNIQIRYPVEFFQRENGQALERSVQGSDGVFKETCERGSKGHCLAVRLGKSD